jgi:hypothetical protein
MKNISFISRSMLEKLEFFGLVVIGFDREDTDTGTKYVI